MKRARKKVTRIALLADSHFDEASRFDECRRLHDWIGDDMAAREVDLVLHAGDVFEAKSTPREREAVAEWLARIARHAPVLLVRGNHDAIGDLAIFERLRTEHPVIVEERAAVHTVAGAAIACLAWPRKAEILARVAATVGHAESEQVAAEAMRAVLTGFRTQLETHDGPRILLAHAMVRGATTSLGQPLVGCDLEIGAEDLALSGAQFVGIGHIHKGQDWSFGGVPVVYPGSPRRTAFGELEEKGYVLVTFEGERVTWEKIVAPATRMLLVEGAFSEARLDLRTDDLDVTGAELRLRYEVESDERDAAKRAASELRDVWLGQGAVAVKVEEVVRANVRARAPEIAAARTTRDKLAAYWNHRNTTPDPARAARLFSRLAEIETEGAHA